MNSFRSFWLIDLGKTFRCLRRTRFLHVMHNDKFNAPFIELVQQHFPNQGHVFLIFGGVPEQSFSIPNAENVLVLRHSMHLWLLGLFMRKARRIFFHSFVVRTILRFARRFGIYLPKASWIIWGADLYDHQKTRKKSYHRIKQAVVSRLGSLIVVAPGDFNIAQSLHDFRGPGYYGLYRLPVTREILDRCKLPQNGNADGVVIQLNNSCDESLIPGLLELQKFRNDPVTVRTIVSYGKKGLKDKVMVTGNRLFREKFLAVTEYLPPQEYAKLMAQVRVLVMNQPRQQGLGNIYGFLYLGTKVYIRSDITTWSFLRERGFEIFDTLRLGEESFENLVRFDEQARRRNQDLAAQMLDDNYIASLWAEIFTGRAQPLKGLAGGMVRAAGFEPAAPSV